MPAGFTQAAGQSVWAASLDELEQQKQQTQQDAQDATQDLEDAKDRTDSLQEEAEALEGEYRSSTVSFPGGGQISDTEEAIATTSEDIDDLNAQLRRRSRRPGSSTRPRKSGSSICTRTATIPC